MNVKIEQLSSVKKRLSFEVSVETVDAEMKKAYKKIGQTAKVKGFRPGKIPFPVLEQYYAPQVEQQVLNRLINDSYFKALIDHRIPAVSDPEIVDSSPLEKGKSFTYEAEVEVRPEIEPKDYLNLTLQKEKFVFDAATVPGRLQEMRESRSEMKASEREAAAAGDLAVIDFEGFVDGTPFEGGKAEGQSLELGSGSFIPGFEDQVVGMKLGEQREINVTFPENYAGKELAGKDAVFQVVLRELKEKSLPALDDDFAKGFGLDSLAELEQKIEETFRNQESSRIESELRERLMKALVERNPMEVPEALVRDQLGFMMENIGRRLKNQGMSMEMLGMNEESFRSMYRDAAVGQVQGSLLLEAVARTEDIKVDPAEIEGKLQEIATLSQAPLDAVKKYYAADEARRGLISQIAEEKVIRFLLDGATIVEVDKSELNEPENAGDKE